MPAPNSIPCSVVDCEYTTPAGCPTWDLLRDFLQQHRESVHPAANGPRIGHTAKLESLPRPKFTLDMSESQWQFTQKRWDAYIAQTVASEDQKMEQLQAACDVKLLQCLYDSGTIDFLDTTQKMITKMKELSVISIHESIHMMNLMKMTQETTESIRAYAARITGKADLCKMKVKCTKVGCNTEIPYRDKIVLQVVYMGMKDEHIRARVLTQTAAGKLSTLKDIIDYIAAEETSILQSQDICHESSEATIQAIRDKSKYKLKRCGYCGEKPHGDNSVKEREKSCKGYNNKCSNCTKLPHLPSVCPIFGLSDSPV